MNKTEDNFLDSLRMDRNHDYPERTPSAKDVINKALKAIGRHEDKKIDAAIRKAVE